MDPAAIAAWLKTSTSGQGATILLATIVALAQGSVTLHDAIPVLLGGIALVIWPQKPEVASAVKTTASALEPLFLAYRTGLEHGASAVQAPAVVQIAQPVAPAAAQPPAPL